MRIPALLALACLLSSTAARADLPAAPETPRRPVVNEYQGVRVTDDYQWLEDSKDPSVKRWSDAQNARTRAYLDGLPVLAQVRARVDQILRSRSVDYDVWKMGGRFFAYKNDPKKQQMMLVTLDSIDDLKSEHMIVDPNAMDAKGSIAIDWATASVDGSKVAVSLSRGGSEAGDLHVYEVATGREVAEVIPHVQNGTAGGSAAFSPDGSGLWYTRYPRGSEHSAADSGLYQQVWFHVFGTKTEDDTYELGRQLPKIAEIVLSIKEDGKWVLAQVKNGDGGEVEYYLRPATPRGTWTQLTRFEDKIVQARFGADQALYLFSRNGAPNGKILRLPLDASPALLKAVEIVKESATAIDDGGLYTNPTFLATASRLYVSYIDGGPSHVRVFDLAGKPLGSVPLLPVSTVAGLVPLEGDDVLFFNQSYLNPGAYYRYRAATGSTERTAIVDTSIVDYSDAEVIREYARSKDGTMVPLNIIKKVSTKLDGSNPTILYAYGGFGISMTPSFRGVRRIWLDHGGIYVVANIRGGGEFGDRWHTDGYLLKKQNDYDDFYACARWLIDHKYTSPQKLAILGGSNGGLLMGAVLTQHPETYRAVVSEVGIYDMLRVELTTNGAFNVTEYGTVKDPAQFKALYAYSPYHHVVDGVRYPSVLLMTGANDPRVEPWHSRKFCARLQAATASSNPILLRTTDSAGHGIGTALNELIAETADLYAFLLHEVGADTQAAN